MKKEQLPGQRQTGHGPGKAFAFLGANDRLEERDLQGASVCEGSTSFVTVPLIHLVLPLRTALHLKNHNKEGGYDAGEHWGAFPTPLLWPVSLSCVCVCLCAWWCLIL